MLVYAQAGSGRRASLFTDYTFAVWRGDELVPVAKAYSGLTEQEILALDRWIRANTVERFGPVRQVEPEHVFELAFEGINRSTAPQVGRRAALPAHRPLAHRQARRRGRPPRPGACAAGRAGRAAQKS